MGDMPEPKIACPVDSCTERVSKRGLHSHLQTHGYSMEEGLQLAQEAKDAHEETSKSVEGPSHAEESGRAGDRSMADDPKPQQSEGGTGVQMRDDMSRLREDEIDRLIERLLRRRDQRERVRMVGDLSDQDGGAGSELKEVLEVARELQELANSGEQRGLELEDVRELIEANGQPSSGAEAHPEAGLLASAIRAGADAETVRELADVDPQIKELELKERRLESRQQMVGELVNGLAEANLGRALGEFVRGLKGGAPAGRSGAGDRGHRPARRERGRGRPRARGERPEDRWPEVEAQGPPNKRERQSKARERAEEADA